MDASKETKHSGNTLINGRRDFIKKAAYTAPVILTMTAIPAFASSGSGGTSNPPVFTP